MSAVTTTANVLYLQRDGDPLPGREGPAFIVWDNGNGIVDLWFVGLQSDSDPLTFRGGVPMDSSPHPAQGTWRRGGG